MNVILPIHKEYSDRIFSGEKPYEFRNQVPKVNKGDKAFIYETKKKNGSGMVVGYFTVKDVEAIIHLKLGAYYFLPEYVKIHYDEEVQRLVQKAMSVDLNHCDNSLVLSYFLFEDCLDEMIQTKRPPQNSLNQLLLNNIREYQKTEKLQDKIVRDCDEWLKRIGFYNAEYGECSTWKNRIVIADAIKYETPIPITEFKNRDGNQIKKAPQSYCYTINE